MWFESSAFRLQCAHQFSRELVKMQIDWVELESLHFDFFDSNSRTTQNHHLTISYQLSV